MDHQNNHQIHAEKLWQQENLLVVKSSSITYNVVIKYKGYIRCMEKRSYY